MPAPKSPRAFTLLIAVLAFALFGPLALAQPFPASSCAADRGISNLNCTANDIEIASVSVNNAVTSCRAGDQVTLDLTAHLHVNAQDRHDIGVFLARDGRSPIAPAASGGSASCSVFGIPMSPIPFADLDGNGCGDFDRDGLPQGTEVALPLGTITLLCTPSPTGRLLVPSAVTWDTTGTTTSCQVPMNQWVRPGSPSKCEASLTLDVPVTVQGKISITKQTLPDAAAGTFAFTATGTGVTPTSFNLTDGQTTTLTTGDLTTFAANYTITETALAGFDSTAQIACYDRDGDPQTAFVTTSGSTRTLTVAMSASPAAGLSEVYCTFTNTKLSGITIVKNTVGGDGTFGFNGSQSFNITTTGGTGQNAITGLSPGQYSVSEVVPTGWDLTGLSCTDPSGGTTTSGATASIDLAAGETVTCTFTDTLRGSIQISKSTVGGDGTFSFSSVPALSGLSTITTSGGTGGPVTIASLPPGPYAVTESVPAGWDLTGINCTDPSGGTTSTGSTANIALAAGETVSCTFADTKRASITVVKNTTGGDGTFAFSATGGISFSITTTSGNAQNTTALASVVPGAAVSITETAQAGWTLQSASCRDAGTSAAVGSSIANGVSVTPTAGQSIICTFNDVKLATLTIYKHTEPHAAQLFNFGATGLTPNSFSLKDDGVNPNFITYPNLAPGSGGTYTVNEVAQAGYVLTALTCSDVSDPDPARRSTVSLATATVTPHLDAGESLSCTFTNTLIQPGSITVTKHAIGGDGIFPFTNSGGIGGSLTNPSAFSITTTGANHTGAQGLTGLAAGTYTITESVPSGWDLTTPISCVVTSGTNTNVTQVPNGVTIDLGTTGVNIDAVACEFMDTRRGSITIVKTSSPQDAQAFTFNTTSSPATTALPASFTLADSGTPPNSQAFSDRVPGTYTVTEAATADWVLTDISCTGGTNVTTSVATGLATIGLAPGENVVCTFANAKNGTITVTKTAVGGTASDLFTFTGALPGTIAGGQALSGIFAAGTYAFSEAVPAGWDLTGIVCNGGTSTFTGASGGGNAFEAGDITANVTIATGQASACTFTNTKRGQIRIVKRSVGGDGSFSFTGARAFTITTSGGQGQDVTTYASVAPGTYTVTEAVPAGWRLNQLTCSNASTVTLGTATANVAVAPGEVVTCTFIDVRNGTITITKRIDGDDPTTATFQVSTALEPTGSFSLTAQPNPGWASRTFADVPAGTYTVTELGPAAGWVSTGVTCTDPTGDTVVNAQARTATMVLQSGEGIECTFSNVSLSTVTVNVMSIGGTGYFGFSTPGLGPDYIEATLADGVPNGRTFHNLMPGAYQINGLGATSGNWLLYGVQCVSPEGETYWTISGGTTSINLTHGEELTCTYFYRVTSNIVVPGSQAIPTMSEWGMIIMATLLAFAAMVTLRRRGAGSRAGGR